MIKNVIFDFGQVLVRFDPMYMTGRYVSDPVECKLLSHIIFDRLYWDALDAGTISDEAVVDACRERLPERFHDTVSDIYYNWIYNIPEIEGMDALIREIREEFSPRLFLLSNISEYFADHAREIPILSHFEHCVFSAKCGFVKPSPEIFEHLCELGGILPSETLFIDDSPKNVAGAEAFGIKGYIFDGDVKKLRGYLREALTDLH